MEKNPISFLQEHMAKNKFSMPKYTTIEEHNGTHINHFVIKVESGEYSATGEGSSKKEARTNAAIKMLALLNLNSKKIITKNSALSDHQLNSKSTSIQDNYVGKLQVGLFKIIKLNLNSFNLAFGNKIFIKKLVFFF